VTPAVLDKPSIPKTAPARERHRSSGVERGLDGKPTLVNARVAVIIVNYRTPELCAQCLESLAPEAARRGDLAVIVVDNGSQPPCHDEIERVIRGRGWTRWAHVLPMHENRGFAAGNNAGLAAARADFYLLLNSDTIVRPGAIDELVGAAERHPRAGLIGPRLEWPDGRPQESAFRERTPRTELLAAASTGLLTRLLGGRSVALPVSSTPMEAEWLSFACVLIRAEVVRDVGPLDDRYFMYLEDIDYCRRARGAGWRCLYWPLSRVVHLRGGTSSVKRATQERKRRPRYYYESRARYFAKRGGSRELWLANLLWTLGRLVALAREVTGLKSRHTCRAEWRDIWTSVARPLGNPKGRASR